MARECAVREQPDVANVSQQSKAGKFGIDEIAQLEEQAANDAIVEDTVNEMDEPEQEKHVVKEDISSETLMHLRKQGEENGDDLDETTSNFDTAAEEEHSRDSSSNVGDARNITQDTITKLKEEHKAEIATLQQYYEERTQSVTVQTMQSLQNLYRDMKTANRALKEQYSRDIQRIKTQLVKDEEKNDPDTISQLQEEIIRLQLRLGQEQQEPNVDNRQMTLDFQALQQDQLLLQRLIRDQQKELDTAQAIRALMLKSLWQQDEEEGVARKENDEAITNLAGRIRSRLEGLSPEAPFDETRDAIETTEERSNQDDDDISAITDQSPMYE
jgi:hypothetical protein